MSDAAVQQPKSTHPQTSDGDEAEIRSRRIGVYQALIYLSEEADRARLRRLGKTLMRIALRVKRSAA